MTSTALGKVSSQERRSRSKPRFERDFHRGHVVVAVRSSSRAHRSWLLVFNRVLRSSVARHHLQASPCGKTDAAGSVDCASDCSVFATLAPRSIRHSMTWRFVGGRVTACCGFVGEELEGSGSKTKTRKNKTRKPNSATSQGCWISFSNRGKVLGNSNGSMAVESLDGSSIE